MFDPYGLISQEPYAAYRDLKSREDVELPDSKPITIGYSIRMPSAVRATRQHPDVFDAVVSIDESVIGNDVSYVLESPMRSGVEAIYGMYTDVVPGIKELIVAHGVGVVIVSSSGDKFVDLEGTRKVASDNDLDLIELDE